LVIIDDGINNILAVPFQALDEALDRFVVFAAWELLGGAGLGIGT